MTRSQQGKAAGGQSQSGDRDADAYRQIPPVHQLVDALLAEGWEQRAGRGSIADAARDVLQQHRASLDAGGASGSPPTLDEFVRRAGAMLKQRQRPPLQAVINATGIIIHTGLGRAPLAESVIDNLADVARGYAPIELNLADGRRGQRTDVVRELLCACTGAESATVVNNNAAGLMLALAVIAKDRPVIVSRGELIEIGGSFRLPRIMAASGAILREVGTTNKTRLGDYERAIDDDCAAILKVHPSNYRVEGFAQSVDVDELAALASARALPLISDIGSGLLAPSGHEALADEPTASAHLRAGADLVLFSGDKLLGGPQAGIILGRRALIDRIEAHPMMRAMRLDKLILAALGTTLQLHRDPDRAVREIPVHAMLNTPLAELEQRGVEILKRIDQLDGIESAELSTSSAYLGGGAVPAQAIESRAIVLRPSGRSEQDFAARLRAGQPAVIPIVQSGSVHLDLRTIFPSQDEALIEAIGHAAGEL